MSCPVAHPASRPRTLWLAVVRHGARPTRSATARLAIVRVHPCGAVRLLAVGLRRGVTRHDLRSSSASSNARAAVRHEVLSAPRLGTASLSPLKSQPTTIRPSLARVLRQHGWQLAVDPPRPSRVRAWSVTSVAAPPGAAKRAAATPPAQSVPCLDDDGAPLCLPGDLPGDLPPTTPARPAGAAARFRGFAAASAVVLASVAMFAGTLWVIEPPRAAAPRTASAADAPDGFAASSQPASATSEAPTPADVHHLHLTGVMLGPSGTGMALISGDDGATRAVPVGAVVERDLILISLTETRASLGPAVQQAPTLVLELEANDVCTTRARGAGERLDAPAAPGTDSASQPADDLSPPPDSTAATGQPALSRGRHMRLRR